jgi:coproporphyrinogen III oxidase-like Fe-S oxidoreductase
MGLRLAAGIDPVHFEARTGVALADAIDPTAQARLQAMGLLAPGPRLAATPEGRAVTNRLILELSAGLKEGDRRANSGAGGRS